MIWKFWPCNHTWKDATCTEPKTCSVCNETEGEALGHTWMDATYNNPKTCSICGETEEEPLQRVQSNNSSSNSRSNNSSRTTQTKKCLICGKKVSHNYTQYCDTHDCSQSNCPYPAKKAGSTYGSLCEFHSCHYKDCLSIPVGGTKYCPGHLEKLK